MYEPPSRSALAGNFVEVLLSDPSDTRFSRAVMAMSFDVTVCQNFVTWNKPYSLFTYLTFVQRKGYFLLPMIECTTWGETGGQQLHIAAAGYDIKDFAWHTEQNDEIVVLRCFSDKRSWIIDLPT